MEIYLQSAAGGTGHGGPGGENSVAEVERVPRGRCMPPVAPAPSARRADDMAKKNKHGSKKKSAIRPPGRRESRIVVLKDGRADRRKPMTEWKRGYVGFKRKVG